jgi:hypothetical protein
MSVVLVQQVGILVKTNIFSHPNRQADMNLIVLVSVRRVLPSSEENAAAYPETARIVQTKIAPSKHD